MINVTYCQNNTQFNCVTKHDCTADYIVIHSTRPGDCMKLAQHGTGEKTANRLKTSPV